METDVLVERPERVRSSVSNGRLHPKGVVDGRSRSGRRFRDITESLAEAVGPAELSGAHKAIVRNVASLIVQSEALQAAQSAAPWRRACRLTKPAR